MSKPSPSEDTTNICAMNLGACVSTPDKLKPLLKKKKKKKKKNKKTCRTKACPKNHLSRWGLPPRFARQWLLRGRDLPKVWCGDPRLACLRFSVSVSMSMCCGLPCPANGAPKPMKRIQRPEDRTYRGWTKSCTTSETLE